MLLKKTTLALASMAALASSGTCLTGAMAAEPAKAELTMAPQYALSWPQDLGKVDLFVAPVPDQTKMTPVRRDISETAMTLVSPLPGTTRAYFFIKPENGKPGIWVSNRVLPTQGVANFRDMGGYETTDHHHVRWGEFYRSAAPSGLTQNDYAYIDTLGIKSVTDLRTQAEQKKQPTRWQGVSPAFFPSEKPDLPSDMTDRSRLSTMSDTQAKALMETFYAQMPDYYAPELKALFARLLAHQTPTLTHCTAGKDRTGFASALILYALGVPEQTILSDYAMSGDLLRAHLTPSFKAAMADHQNGGAMAASPSMRAMLNSDPDYLKAAFASIRKHYGSIDAYLAQKLAVGPQQLTALRSLYLD
ncbi:tyrosine-protein phosphatase [Asaia sp. BMEF1]|uniref:tyrosine-protein phosphatase n=1 Tax=Asaia sp. BMEF1 TaxID=3155932 RepID=UPI003F66BDE4